MQKIYQSQINQKSKYILQCERESRLNISPSVCMRFTMKTHTSQTIYNTGRKCSVNGQMEKNNFKTFTYPYTFQNFLCHITQNAVAKKKH